ncbi:hypothetical protein BH708_13915 [Brachybacterium sp. P6-10-X1]|uniref:hypothetical protein n=1 Tax=Brachybacterium sp. P6-10-X1 TaxID=1903186 RepID=UPI0009717C1D|nr:hypothetical protein [Brachybacterium sp. P6-10-X1]APX33631.1 hypothetical protein BH708_13915 [Brachybacterium sp. P6-10-X1]
MTDATERRERSTAPFLWAWRVLLTVAAAGYLFQAVSAGQFLQGDYAFLRFHQVGTTTLDVVMVLALLAAGALRWVARGPLLPLLGTLGVFAVSQAQAGTGAARMVWLHVPLGVVLIGLVWLLAWYAWTSVRREGRR